MVLKPLKNRRGMALLITLSVITVVVAAAVELNRKVRSAVVSTAATRDRLRLYYMTQSGVNAAMAMLVKDKNESEIDSMQEDWAQSEEINELLGDIRFDQGNVQVTISDELGKIQVNALLEYFPEKKRNDVSRKVKFNESQRLVWDRVLEFLFENFETPEDMSETLIIHALKDWMDEDDDPEGWEDTESDYYRGLDPPYSCKNGPFSHIGELRLLNGVTAEMYEGVGAAPGLPRYVTTYGDMEAKNDTLLYSGKININTAEIPVIAAMITGRLENLEFADNIAAFREEKSDDHYINSLTDAEWYKRAPGCSDADIDENIITLKSDIFRIEAAAALNDLKMTRSAVVVREKDKETGKIVCRVLDWRPETLDAAPPADDETPEWATGPES